MSQRVERINLPAHAELICDAGELLATRGADVFNRTRQWQPGLRAANPSGGTRNGSDVSDPTGRSALSAEPDPHARYLELVQTATAACRDLLGFIQQIPDIRSPRWCWWHEQVGMKVPAYERLNIDGKPACQWAYRIYRKTGQPPTLEQTRRHAEGTRVRVA